MSDLQAFNRTEQRRRKREAVLHAAAASFNRFGFDNTSMDDVAATLGVSKATLYQYFRSKQDILYECHLTAMRHGDAGLVLAREQGGSGREKLFLYLRRYMEGAFNDLGGLSILSDVNSLTPEARAEVVKGRSAISHAVDDLVAEGVADGSIAGYDPKIAKLFAMGVVNWIPAWYRADGPNNPEEIIDEFIRIFRYGLEPRTDEPA